MKKAGMMIIGVVFSLYGFSQTTQEKVEKQLQDSQRKANSGKADVIRINKKAIFDSTTLDRNDTSGVNNARADVKRKNCATKAGRGKTGTTPRRT